MIKAQLYKVTITNQKTGQTATRYAQRRTPDQALRDCFNSVNDRTPLQDKPTPPLRWIVEVEEAQEGL